jgi:hypothetical protein
MFLMTEAKNKFKYNECIERKKQRKNKDTDDIELYNIYSLNKNIIHLL